jgi:heat-inducible transcriptional repressor
MRKADVERLDERKEKILAAIVESYVRHNRPVGSASVVALAGLDVSPATVRNEMRALEELGMLEQPHVSAGRVPTQYGYRYYVDHLLKERKPSAIWPAELVSLLERSSVHGELEATLAGASKVLSEATRQAAVIAGPFPEDETVKAIHFSAMSDDSVLISVITRSGRAILRTLRLDFSVPISLLERAEDGMHALDGMPLGELGPTIAKLKPIEAKVGLRSEEDRRYGELWRVFLEKVGSCLTGIDSDPVPWYVGGTARVAAGWPSGEWRGFGGLLQTLEEPNALIRAMKQIGAQEGVRVLIGSEIPVRSLRSCSVVAAGVVADSKVIGCVGVVGPMRMDYSRVIPAVKDTSAWLSGRMLFSHG